jgi:RNA polymerase sigma-70 factor (ECF subfamily)
MAPADDHLADSDSLLASRDPELTARFIDDALPYLNQLTDRARRLTTNTVEADDLVQEAMLRAYTCFNTFAEGTDLRAWLYRIMTDTRINCLRRAGHGPGEYLLDRHRGAQDRYFSHRPRSTNLMQWIRFPALAGFKPNLGLPR